jgi:hypothetical protein
LCAGLLYGRLESKSRLGTPGKFFPLSEEAIKKNKRGLAEWIWNELYECDYECTKKKTKLIKNSLLDQEGPMQAFLTPKLVATWTILLSGSSLNW